MAGFPRRTCELCGLPWAICIHIVAPVEPGSDGDKWLKARRQEREARQASGKEG